MRQAGGIEVLEDGKVARAWSYRSLSPRLWTAHSLDAVCRHARALVGDHRLRATVRACGLAGGTVWAGGLVVLGLEVAVRGSAQWSGLTCVSLGAASAAAGSFLFMTLVADRVCPLAARRPPVWRAESAAFAILVAAGVAAWAAYRGAFA